MIKYVNLYPFKNIMPLYVDLQKAVIEHDEEKTHVLLNELPAFVCAELFMKALEEENYLIITTLLEFATRDAADASYLLTKAVAQNLSTNTAALLAIHGFSLDYRIGGISLFEIISKQDSAFAIYLEETSNILNETRRNMDSAIEKMSPENINFNPLHMLRDFTYSFRAHNADSLLVAIDHLNELIAIAADTCRLYENPDVKEEDREIIRNEIRLAYLLYKEYPFSENHITNLATRLKEIGYVGQIGSEQTTTEVGAHRRLIQCTAAIKENPDVILEGKDGQCFGYGLMIALAMLSSDLKTSRQILELVNTIPVDQIKAVLEKNRIEMLERYKKMERSVEPTEEQRKNLAVEVFLQGMGFAQQSQNWASDFDMPLQTVSEIMSVILPKKIEDEVKKIKEKDSHPDSDVYAREKYKDAVVEIFRFEGYYDYADLLTYFNQLRRTIDESELPFDFIVLTLQGIDHLTTLGYDIQNHHWVFADPNRTDQIDDIVSDALLAIRVMFALRFQHRSATIRKIITNIYATKSQQDMVSGLVERWLNLPKIQAILSRQRQETLSSKKPTFQDMEGSLTMAVLSGKVGLLRFAVNHSNINQRLASYTPLTLAIKRDDLAVAQFLIENGADVNLADEFNTPLAWSLQASTPEMLILLLNSGVEVSAEQIIVLRCKLQRERKLEYLLALLQNANPCIKAAIIKDVHFLYLLYELLPESDAFAYFSSAEFREYLLGWVINFSGFMDLLEFIPLEERFCFFKQKSTQEILILIGRFDVSIVVHSLRTEDTVPFLEQEIVKENLKYIDGNALAKIILCLPEDKIEPFLKPFKRCIKEWTKDPNLLCRIIKALPPALIGSFIKQYVCQEDRGEQLTGFLIEFNNYAADTLVECLIHLPGLLDSVQDGEAIYNLLENNLLKVDKYKFIENLVCVYRHTHTLRQLRDKIETQYNNNTWVSEELTRANQKYRRPAEQNMSLLDVAPLLFFNSGEEVPLDPGYFPTCNPSGRM